MSAVTPARPFYVDRVVVGLTVLVLVIICGISALAIWSVNGAKNEARSDAGAARIEVVELQREAACRDELSAAVDLATVDQQAALSAYIRALGQGGDTAAALARLTAADARMDTVATARADTDQRCSS